MRAFVTGAQGFVGAWLIAHLEEMGDEVVPAGDAVDVTDGAVLSRAVRDARPDAVYHLAAFTHVGQSWDAPEEAFRVNAVGTLHLLEAARACGRDPRVLLVSSAEVYGAVGAEELPLTESTALRPLTPYAASKVAAEYLGLQAHLGHGLAVVRVRPFNHVGPGQAPSFVVAALARRIVEADRAGAGSVAVGNLSPHRDFTDVRDVVRAYRALVVEGEPGGVYNVCSGHDVAISDVAERLLTLAGAHLRLEVDPALARPTDVPVLRGDPTLLRDATGWAPRIALDDTLVDVLKGWQKMLV